MSESATASSESQQTLLSIAQIVLSIVQILMGAGTIYLIKVSLKGKNVTLLSNCCTRGTTTTENTEINQEV